MITVDAWVCSVRELVFISRLSKVCNVLFVVAVVVVVETWPKLEFAGALQNQL